MIKMAQPEEFQVNLDNEIQYYTDTGERLHTAEKIANYVNSFRICVAIDYLGNHGLVYLNDLKEAYRVFQDSAINVATTFGTFAELDTKLQNTQ